MADDTAGGGGKTLTASVGEQLREKAELDRAAESKPRAGEQVYERTERKKAVERSVVLQHTRGERRVKPPTGKVARAADLANEARWVPLVASGAGLIAIGYAGHGFRRGVIIALGAALVMMGVLVRRGAAVHL